MEPAEPTPPAAAETSADLPELPVAQHESGSESRHRIERLVVNDQDVRVVVESLAENFGLDYSIDPAVQARVSTRLHGVSLEEALETILAPHGYTHTLRQNVLRVVPARYETRILSLEYMAISRAGSATTVVQRRLGGTSRQRMQPGVQGLPGQQQVPGGGFGAGDAITSVTLSDLWAELRVGLESLVFEAAQEGEAEAPLATQPGAIRAPTAFQRQSVDGRRLIINPRVGQITITAPADRLADVERFLAAFEASVQRQVLIEAKIVEVHLDRRFEFGIDWNFVRRLGAVDLEVRGGEARGVELTLGPARGGADPIGLVLRALEEQGRVRVLSSPRVSALNNERAIFHHTTDEVFFAVTREPVIGPGGATIGFQTQIDPQQISVGIVLDVFPQLGPDNTITMSVRPVVTNVVRTESIELEDGTRATAPVIDRREIDTMVRLRGGETIVIGGLMETRQSERERGVPILRSIPIIGGLFRGISRQEENTELVIFLTPTIVAGEARSF